MIVLPEFAFAIYSREFPSFRNGDADGSAAEVGIFAVVFVVAKRREGLVVGVARQQVVAVDAPFDSDKWNNFELVAGVAAAAVVAAGNWVFAGKLAVNASFVVVVVDD